jgi:hypothetical protein
MGILASVRVDKSVLHKKQESQALHDQIVLVVPGSVPRSHAGRRPAARQSRSVILFFVFFLFFVLAVGRAWSPG